MWGVGLLLHLLLAHHNLLLVGQQLFLQLLLLLQSHELLLLVLPDLLLNLLWLLDLHLQLVLVLLIVHAARNYLALLLNASSWWVVALAGRRRLLMRLMGLTVLLRVLKHHCELVGVVAWGGMLITANSRSALVAMMSSFLFLHVLLTFIICKILRLETTVSLCCMLCGFRLML